VETDSQIITCACGARVRLPSQPGQQALRCPRCKAAFDHRECWTEVGGCSTYGCKQAPAPEKEAPAAQPLTAWGDTKVCPVCRETIKSIALRCRYCGTQFDTVDPLTVADLHRQARTGDTLAVFRKQVIALFVASILGLIAPLTLILGLVWLLPRRDRLEKAGPIYKILGYSAMVLSGLYSLLMLSFLVVPD
jgi:hypothetical protein